MTFLFCISRRYRWWPLFPAYITSKPGRCIRPLRHNKSNYFPASRTWTFQTLIRRRRPRTWLLRSSAMETRRFNTECGPGYAPKSTSLRNPPFCENVHFNTPAFRINVNAYVIKIIYKFSGCTTELKSELRHKQGRSRDPTMADRLRYLPSQVRQW